MVAEVSGTRHKPGPDASDLSSAIDLGTRLHRSRVPASKRKGCPALLGKTSVALRSTGLGQRFPTRARAEAWPVGDPSVIWRGAVQKRRTQLVHSSACSTNAWEKKSNAFPNCAGPHSKPPRERRCRKLPMSFSRHAPGNNNPQLRPPSPRRVTELESHGPRSGQMPTREKNPPRRRLLWARSGAAFRAAFGHGLGRSASAHSRRCAAKPSRRALKSIETLQKQQAKERQVRNKFERFPMCRTGKSLRIFSSPAAFRHSDPWIMAKMRDGTPLEISMKFSAPPERLGASHAPRGRRSRVPWGWCQFVTKVEKKTQRTPAKIVFVARPGSGCDARTGNQALWASLGEGWTCVKAAWGFIRGF